MNADVVIIILNWNRWRDTLECLESVFNMTYDSFSVVVIDNDSSDGSRDHILKWITSKQSEPAGLRVQPRLLKIIFENDYSRKSVNQLHQGEIIYIQASTNGGFAAGNNLGMKQALTTNARYVWLLNNDTMVTPEALDRLVQKSNSDDKIGMCGSLLCFYDKRDVVQAFGGVEFNLFRARGSQIGLGLQLPNSGTLASISNIEPTYISGASMLIRTDLLREIGLMDEKYFLYYEEIDLAERSKHYWKLAIAGDSIVYHKEGCSIGTASLSKRSVESQYYFNRNLIRFYALWHPLLLPVAIARVFRESLACIIRADFNLFIASGRALIHALTGKYGQALF